MRSFLDSDENSINLDVNQDCRRKLPGYFGGMKCQCEAVVDSRLIDAVGPSGKRKRAAEDRQLFEIDWRPQGDSNPRYRRERAVSWAGLDDGDSKTN